MAPWHGVSWRRIFRMRTTYGPVAGSTLEDWPISYDELEPYYEKAEWEMGVSGDDINNVSKDHARNLCRCRPSRRIKSIGYCIRPRNGWAGIGWAGIRSI